MKKNLLFFLFLLSSAVVFGQGMSDQQVAQFIASEAKAGTSQSQIVTKLMQKGVKIDQIRRLRDQHAGAINQSGMSGQADAGISDMESRMRTNTEGADEGQTGAATHAAPISAPVAAAEPASTSRIYGHDIFNKRLLSFEPSMNIATPQNYVLGPGDVVIVDIYGASQKSGQLEVSPEGTVVIEGYGPVKVGGLTVAAARQKLRSTLGARYKSSSLDVNVGQTRSIMVNVMGEVNTPGTYTLSAFSTVFHALYMAGGIKDLGTLRNIKVYRNGRHITTVDVYQYILNGRLSGNIRLQENDMIIVEPYQVLVDVTGKVKRPMIYEMRSTESVAQVIKYAGGFTSDAYKKAVRLTRQSGERYSVHTIEEFDMSGFKVADGDAVQVDSMIDRYENMVEIKGAVFRPGQYELGKQISSVRALVEAAGGLQEDAFTSRAVLTRMKPDRTLETQALDLSAIMSGTAADIPLRNEDVLLISTQAERQSQRTLTITGEVTSPGTFPYADNTTIEDLIVMAGGLRDQASLTKVDVSRRILDPLSTKKSDVIAKTFTFELKDGLVMTSGQGFVLEPYDVVNVYRSPAFSTARNIMVRGEVNYEGNFTLPTKKTRLSDAVKMAGGITDAANLRGARLIRQMNEDEIARSQATMKALRNILTERGDSIDFSDISPDSLTTYLVGINLEEAVKNPGSDKDIILREGDELVIPEFSNMVKISGDVFYPNVVTYEEGKSAKYYVNQAGGFGNRAKKSKTFIVYQNGNVGVVSKGAKPEPGCEIIVPSKKRRNPVALASLLSVGTSIASLAAMVVALARR